MHDMELLAAVHPRTCCVRVLTVRFKSDAFEDDILPIDLSNNNLKGYQKAQLAWAKDGTIVQRLGKNKLLGEIIGVPFRCPRFYLDKKQRLSRSALVYCVQVFFRSNSRFVTEPLGNYKLITASNIAYTVEV